MWRSYDLRFLRAIAAASCAIHLMGCDSPTSGGSDCDDEAISSHLKQVLYWGYVSATEDQPNQGTEIGSIRQPVWGHPDRIYVNTGQMDAGTFVRGIYEIEVDSVSYSFKQYKPFEFPYLIRHFDYEPSTDRMAVTFSRDAVNIQTVIAQGVEPTLVVNDTLVSSSWFPRAARFVDGGGVIAYASNPTTQTKGFYFFSVPAGDDSLVIAVDLSIGDARGFDVSGGTMCFGVTSDSIDQTTIKVIDLDGDRLLRDVRVLSGQFVSASVDPTGSCAVVSVEVFVPTPGNRVGIVNLTTGAFAELDVRTRPCGFVIADFPDWSPSGNAFAFSGAAFTGEGDRFPRKLWAWRDAICQ